MALMVQYVNAILFSMLIEYIIGLVQISKLNDGSKITPEAGTSSSGNEDIMKEEDQRYAPVTTKHAPRRQPKLSYPRSIVYSMILIGTYWLHRHPCSIRTIEVHALRPAAVHSDPGVHARLAALGLAGGRHVLSPCGR